MQSKKSIKDKLHEIIFEADTFGGKAFDIALLIAIIGSISVVMLDSVDSIRTRHGELLTTLEWFFYNYFHF